MIRTLKTYLGRDLAKATALATVGITLVMTVFAVIEPLRKWGMSGRQAMKLFGCFAPVMFSLTLPIAALFAATIVYGRFSRDNELMACRASGISTLSLLKPAILLGAIVSAITLVLILYVAPNLLFLAERTAKKNLQQIVYSRLQKRRYVEFENWIFHADQVQADDAWVKGAVGLIRDRDGDVTCLIAASAYLEFMERDGEMFVEFHPTNPALMQQSGKTVGIVDATRFQRGDLPSIKDKPKFYDWTRLYRAWVNPEKCTIVLKDVRKIKRLVCIQKFYEDVIRRIETSGKYERLQEFARPEAEVERERVVIEAARASLHDGREVHFLAPAAATGPSRAGPKQHAVVVHQYAGQRLKRRLWAQGAIVRGVWDKSHSAVVVTLTLNDVTILGAGGRIEDAHHREEYEVGSFAVPAEIVAESNRISLDELCENAESYSNFPKIQKEIDSLHNRVIPRLLRKVCAEMHQRLAYGISCLLMVMLGAALGLIFRGGEALVAFAISAGPASVVIVLLLMGKQLIANTGVPSAWYGIAVIWGGIAALTAATVYVYAVPMRR